MTADQWAINFGKRTLKKYLYNGKANLAISKKGDIKASAKATNREGEFVLKEASE